nr:unnamed protein product [Naegleria fowleri]
MGDENSGYYNDNTIHVLNIPDNNNSSLTLSVSYKWTPLIPALMPSSILSNVTKCGVKESAVLQQQQPLVEYFRCETITRSASNTTIVVTPKNSANFTEGVYLIQLEPTPAMQLLTGISGIIAQFEIIVYSSDGLSEILQKPIPMLKPPNSELFVNISIPPISVIDPSSPPSLDTLTGQPFIPMGLTNFALTARLGGWNIPKGVTLRYNWSFLRIVSNSLGALDLMSRRNSSRPSNFYNTLQPLTQENSLGFSSIVLSQDKDMELDALYKVSCFVTDLKNRIIAKSSIYLRTPRDFNLQFPTLPPMSVFPQIATFTQLFKFSGQNVVYTDSVIPNSNVLYAYGYLDPLIVSSLSLSDLRDKFSDIPMSQLMTAAIRVTDFSTNSVQYAYLPPSFRQIPGQMAPTNSSDFNSISYSYKHQLVMFVKDVNQSFTKIFLLQDAVCVIPTNLNSVLTFIEQKSASFSPMQLKGIMGMTQRMYQFGDIQLVDQIQRALFNRIQSMISNMTVQDTGKMLDISRIIEMWSYNATNSVRLMAADSANTILSTFSKFFSLLRTDASNNRVTGNNVNVMPIGMRDSSIFSSLASTLSNMIPLSEMKSQTPSLAKLFASTIVDSLSPSEEKRLSTSSLYFTIRKDFAANFNGTFMDSDDSNGVLMPSTVIFNDTAGLYGAELVTYLENPNPSTNNGTSKIQSSVVSLRCINSDGNYFPLSGLSDPLVLTFNVSATELEKPNATVSCKYWNETVNDWKDDGCHLTSQVKMSNYYIISCVCNHTTQFATFVEFSSNSFINYTTEQKTAYYILWAFDVGIGLLFVIVSATILILIIIFRNSQPVKAKYIAPFVGMISILLESFLSYMVKASIMIGLVSSGSNTPFALNTINYISSIIVSVAFCVTVLTFVIQVIRYQLLRRMYSFMSDENMNDKHVDKRISFYRLLSSKKLYFTSVIVISILIFVIFAGLSIGRVGQELAQSDSSKQSFTSVTFTIVTSSVMGFILVVSLVSVTIIFTCDLLYCLIYEYRAKPIVDTSIQVPSYNASTQSTIELSDTSTSKMEGDSNPKKKKLLEDFYIKKTKDLTISSMYRFFIQEDPLFFRAESLLFILCLGVLLASYVFGIVSLGFFISTNTSLDTSNSAFSNSLIMDIVRLILSVVYFVLYVLVFGDLSLLVYIFKYRRNAWNVSHNERFYDQSVESLESGACQNELFEILQDQLALRLFEKFTVKEFSKENLICYHQLMELYTIHKLRELECAKQVKLLENFIGKFLTASSAYEVNIPSHTRTSLLKTVNEKQSVDSQQILKSLDSLKGDLIQNLSDTFSRFITTQSYQFWVKIKQEKQQLMNANKLN